jgi:hypothetical protein
MADLIDLSPLRPIEDRATIAAIWAMPISPQPDRISAGRLGNLAFVVTLDGDGHCEASLSRADRAPTPGEVAAFFRIWGVTPDEPTPHRIFGGKGRMFVVRRAAHAH